MEGVEGEGTYTSVLKGFLDGRRSDDDGALLGDGGDDKVPHLAQLLLGGEPLEDVVENDDISSLEGLSLVEDVVVDDLDAIAELLSVNDLLGQGREGLVELDTDELLSMREEVTVPEDGSETRTDVNNSLSLDIRQSSAVEPAGDSTGKRVRDVV